MHFNEREIYGIGKKMADGLATREEQIVFLNYALMLESMVEVASIEDFYGTEGWKRQVFGD